MGICSGMDNSHQYIRVRGARQHNLKNVDLDIPKNKLVVFTGVSGSGKSSLAFDTIYAEGQRRYVESLSTYARQFLGIMEKPDVDSIECLSPAISIDQKTTSRNPRSTVGTVTEVYDYLRLLYARVGHPHCPVCGEEISGQSVDQIVDSVMGMIKSTVKLHRQGRFMLLSPLVVDKKGEFEQLFANLRSKGLTSVRVDKHIKDLSEDFVLIKTNKHTIEAVVDKFSLARTDIKNALFEESFKSRISQSIETALALSDGLVILSQILDKGFEIPANPKEFFDNLYSEKFACPKDNIQLPEIEPRTFSFNSPQGACSQCSGLGKILKADADLVLSKELTVSEGGILPFSTMFEHDTWYSRLIFQVCHENGIDPKTQIGNLSQAKIDILLGGTGERIYKVKGTNRFGNETYIYEVFHGILAEIERRHTLTESEFIRYELEKYMRSRICPECNGARLKKEALGITIDNQNISSLCNNSISHILQWISDIDTNQILSPREHEIASGIIREIIIRLKFLISVGLDYLTLERSANSLSGGESQRIRLASQIGSGLTGVLYVLDEPTIGLHQRDNQKLIDTLKKLRDMGNSVIVVEHDADMMQQSDYIIDFGPGAGKFGGKLIAKGTPEEIKKDLNSITGLYLSGKRKISTHYQNTGTNKSLSISGCSQYNLKNINVSFPLGKLIVITGVSGSGKSTLLVETLYPALQQKLNPFFRGTPGVFKNLNGEENINKVIMIDQSPIGRTPRSNPATYTKTFDLIRDIFAQSREAKLAGFTKSRFSFNVKGGRCEACEGQGQTKIEMQFMSDIWITCEVCKGKRYNSQTLDVTYRGKNIADILALSVSEAAEFFQSHTILSEKLNTLKSVGLDYIELGQSATTLSGGEAQRVKLAAELGRRDTGKTLYILDEPTTGLHFADLEKLLSVLKLLVVRGNTVVVIEHNIDIIKNADYIIDLGPEGGDGGGKVVAQGKISDIISCPDSFTGKYLRLSK